MFERFTDRARTVLVLAQEEAHLLNHRAIAPEHILLGLLHDGDVGAHWGEALWAAGQKAAARSAWQRALDADPENKLLATTVRHYAPTLAAPKPPPALEPAPRTTI